MKPDELLILEYDFLSQGIQSFVNRMNDSSAFQELFLKDPAGVVEKVVFAGRIQP